MGQRYGHYIPGQMKRKFKHLTESVDIIKNKCCQFIKFLNVYSNLLEDLYFHCLLFFAFKLIFSLSQIRMFISHIASVYYPGVATERKGQFTLFQVLFCVKLTFVVQLRNFSAIFIILAFPTKLLGRVVYTCFHFISFRFLESTLGRVVSSFLY